MLWPGVGQDAHQPAEGHAEPPDVVGRHDVRLLAFGRLKSYLSGGSLGVGLGDPSGDGRRVGSGFQRGTVATELGPAGSDLRGARLTPEVVGRAWTSWRSAMVCLMRCGARTLASQRSTSAVTRCSRTRTLRGWPTLSASAYLMAEVTEVLREVGVRGNRVTIPACDADVQAVSTVTSAEQVRGGGTDRRVDIERALKCRDRPNVITGAAVSRRKSDADTPSGRRGRRRSPDAPPPPT